MPADTNDLIKVPPQNLEAEQSLLGALLLDKEAVFRVIDLVTPEDFYKDTHRFIYEAMVDLFLKHEPIDVLSISNRLEEKKQLQTIGGQSHLVSLVNAVPTADHADNYANIVQRKANLSHLLEAGVKIT